MSVAYKYLEEASMEEQEVRKPYIKPEVVEELELEVRAESGTGFDPLGLQKP